jgi:hypothetical protein
LHYHFFHRAIADVTWRTLTIDTSRPSLLKPTTAYDWSLYEHDSKNSNERRRRQQAVSDSDIRHQGCTIYPRNLCGGGRILTPP